MKRFTAVLIGATIYLIASNRLRVEFWPDAVVLYVIAFTFGLVLQTLWGEL